LGRYLDLPMTPEALTEALSLSGLNHEQTIDLGEDVVIDLEVTSNRGDCLGHLGVAREIAVLYELPLRCPDPQPPSGPQGVEQLLRVSNHYSSACLRYTARVIEGCKVGPSPQWLVDSLAAIGLKSVNNVVDVTNYVMMECGQPLHAFDLDRLHGGEIRVRPAQVGEALLAIDHRSYPLAPEMCVIADAQRPLAVAGVMGGADSEVTEQTKRLVIESAIFTPMHVRQTARALKLHSPSSYRFERRVDPAGVDWASRRACQWMLELGGGVLASGVLDTHPQLEPRKPIVLSLAQFERVLGIQVPIEVVTRILTGLGCRLEQVHQPSGRAPCVLATAPTWRHDLERDVDLVEEVARIYGYDKIPEDSPIPVAPSSRRHFDSALDRVRQTMIAAGISEAMTPSVVTERLDDWLSPWTDNNSLQTITPLLKGANRLRRSLLPSLLQCRADNWSAAGLYAELYEVAHLYLPSENGSALPSEQYTLGIVSGRDFLQLKGVIEGLLRRLGVQIALKVERRSIAGFDREHTAALMLDQHLLGYLGRIDRQGLQQWKLPGEACVAEVALPVLFSHARLVAQFHSISPFPMVRRDLNLIVSEEVHWVDLESSTRIAGGLELAAIEYRETYRDPEKDGRNTKRILFTVGFQRRDTTLTGEEADRMVESILARCRADHGARLLL